VLKLTVSSPWAANIQFARVIYGLKKGRKF
jgi:hypothetical protein